MRTPARCPLVVAATAALVAVSMFTVPSQAQERDPYTADVTVAKAADGKGLWFPDIVKLDDGTLLAAFYEAESHSGPHGRISVAESSDGGQTWSPSRLAVETPFDDRDPKLVQLSDGTVVLSFFQTDWSERPATLRGTYVVRSDDAGRNWSEPVKVGTEMDCGCGAAAGAYLTGWAASHGPVTELPNGDLLIPLYGTVPNDAQQQATVVRSTDGGMTWPAESEIRIFRSEEFHVQEPTLAVLESGRIVALLRTTSSPQVAYISWSANGGQIWTPARATDIPASSHHLLPLSDGGILVTYGDVSSRFSPRRETAGRIVDYPEGTWDGYHDIMLYDSGHGDQANPSSAEVEPGRFLTLSNDLPNRTIVGVFSTRDDYKSPRPGTQIDLLQMHAAGLLTVDTDMDWTRSDYPDVGPLGAIDGRAEYASASWIGRSAPPDTYYKVTFARPLTTSAVGVALKPGWREAATVEFTTDGTTWQEVAAHDGIGTNTVSWTNLPEPQSVTGLRVRIHESDGWAVLAELAVRR